MYIYSVEFKICPYVNDIVTMKWWDDLWLNEGFASFIEYKAVGNMYPSWEIVSTICDY